MKEEALKTILDRQEPRAHMEKDFKETMELLQEVVNYGTNLIPRAFRTSKRDLAAAVILGGFLKQAITMLDAVEILISQGAVLAAQVPARSLFETSLYIGWILNENTDTRAKQYYVWTLRRARMWANRLIPGTDENKDFQNVLQQFPAPSSPEMQKEAQAQVKEIDRLLGKSEYKTINDEFDRLKSVSKKKSYEPPWYQPWGSNSIGDIASRLNRSSEYKLFYAQLSEFAHLEAFKKHVRFQGGTLTFEHIRHLEGIKTLIYNIA
jgi:hypothetical protein